MHRQGFPQTQAEVIVRYYEGKGRDYAFQVAYQRHYRVMSFRGEHRFTFADGSKVMVGPSTVQVVK